MVNKKEVRQVGDTSPVGYRRPPVHTRFKKGVSGNPLGRRKGTRNVLKMFEQELNEPITVVENGKRKCISKGRAAIKRAVNGAASGESKWFKEFRALFGYLIQIYGTEQLRQLDKNEEISRKIQANITKLSVQELEDLEKIYHKLGIGADDEHEQLDSVGDII